jgi:hypothetical protein
MREIGRTLSPSRPSAPSAHADASSRRIGSRFRSAISPYLAILRNLADDRISLISHSYLY